MGIIQNPKGRCKTREWKKVFSVIFGPFFFFSLSRKSGPSIKGAPLMSPQRQDGPSSRLDTWSTMKKRRSNMSIGLRREQVALGDHQKEWDQYGERLIDKLKGILEGEDASFEPIESTSLPDIKAKPIIDIAIGVKSMVQVLFHKGVLEENGFHFRKEDPEGQLLYVVEDDKDHDMVKAHVHVVNKDSKTWKDYLFFRDTLRKDRRKAKEYEGLKIQLAKKHGGDQKSYTKAKQGFIDEILERRRTCKN